MLNLDERYHSYLSGEKKLRIDGIEEQIKSYGYTDNGSDIDGYYITTKNYQLYLTQFLNQIMKKILIKKYQFLIKLKKVIIFNS